MSIPHTLLVLILFICFCTNGISSSRDIQEKNEHRTLINTEFEPQNITLTDDAFHVPKNPIHIETWYFDAKFKNNMSMVLVLNLFQTPRSGLFLYGFYLYNQTSILFAERRFIPKQFVTISYNTPYVQIDNDKTIMGYMDNQTGDWIYQINFTCGEYQILLHLVKTAEGWMGHHFLGWWLVIPKLDVRGKIIIEKKIINVSGLGYHDHNIYPAYIPLLSKGYHFGGFGGDKFHLTWAKFLNRRSPSELIAILSVEETKYYLIKPSDITFSVDKTLFDHGSFIPTVWRLSIDNDLVSIQVLMKTEDVHFISFFGVKYWRFHLKITGTITMNEIIEHVNCLEISELLKF